MLRRTWQGGAKQSYYLTVNRDPRYPGRFCLFYMRKGKHQVGPTTFTSNL